jgi:hypothetical protein
VRVIASRIIDAKDVTLIRRKKLPLIGECRNPGNIAHRTEPRHILPGAAAIHLQ